MPGAVPHSAALRQLENNPLSVGAPGTRRPVQIARGIDEQSMLGKHPVGAIALATEAVKDAFAPLLAVCSRRIEGVDDTAGAA